MAQVTIALAGNPNCGKTTLFNALTGSRQRVGNWPGVTVERLEGGYQFEGRDVHVVDLPGIYSFSAFSIDETIAREYILNERPAVVVNIVDATNLQRHLYLTVQLLEMKVPMVVALNMMDVARQRKLRIEVDHLARHLDCPVVTTIASKGQGIEDLKRAVAGVAARAAVPATRVEYDSELEEAIEALRGRVADHARRARVDERWLAVKLLEQDELALEIAEEQADELLVDETRRIERHTGEDIGLVIADGRYGFIHGLTRDVLHRPLDIRRTLTDAIDRVVLNRVVGIPVFLAAMYIVFTLTITLGDPFVTFFDRLAGAVFVDGLRALVDRLNSPALLTTLLADGLGKGLQTVATFIPPVFLIFLCLSILEDSGYMARAAFMMDHLLRKVGLPGKAFLPMLIGFGCNVPAIMATRTLEGRRDRTLTILVNPLMSCGARLPIYALFAAAFFPHGGGGLLVLALYLTGIILAILTALLLKWTLLRGEAATFVMELPPYHVPTLTGIMHHTWHRLSAFMLRAGKVIITVVALLSVANGLGTDGSFGNENSHSSVLSAVGKATVPVFEPMGVTPDNWPAAVGLFTGILHKEAVIGTLDSLYTSMAAEESRQRQARNDIPADLEGQRAFEFWADVKDALLAVPRGFRGVGARLVDPLGIFGGAEPTGDEQGGPVVRSSTFGAMSRYFGSRAAAVAYLLFVLIYAPCVAAVAAIGREIGARWALFAVAYLTVLAWIVSTVFYQAATLPDHPATSAAWLVGILAGAAAFIATLKLVSRRLKLT